MRVNTDLDTPGLINIRGNKTKTGSVKQKVTYRDIRYKIKQEMSKICTFVLIQDADTDATHSGSECYT